MSPLIELRLGLPTTRDYVWAVASRTFNGPCYYMPISLSSRNDGERALRRIKSRVAAASPRSWVSLLLASMLLRTVISKANIRYVSVLSSTSCFLALML